MSIYIHDDGRISGTRSSIYSVMDYVTRGWDADRIALALQLNKQEVTVAIDYINAHREEVDKNYQEILKRCERGDSPELRARIEAGKTIVAARRAELLRRIAEKANAQPARTAG